MAHSLAEYYARDLNTYQKIENWAAGLFVAGILLITKELAFPELQEHGAKFGNLESWVIYVPAAIGLFGAYFLLLLNWRGRRSRTRYEFAQTNDGNATKAQIEKQPVPIRGWLGWMYAAMPALAGVSATVALEGEKRTWMDLALGIVILFLVGGAVAWDCSHNHAIESS